ncbi:MAG: hypothetical protein R3248_13795, partial [Candidatus Promineifilaceae bacterium]|nr:hypothetical protein [Candidatus Promineifilaceae bacterium]
FRDEERDRRRGNAGNYISMVGLGCLAECVVIAASGEGLAADLAFHYDAQDLKAPWLTVTFQPTPADPDALLSGLRRRCSDRREYQGGSLSDPIFGQVTADADRFRNCRLYFQDPSDQALLAYILRCEEFLWADKHMLPEMLSWVRWSDEEVCRTRDGMPWQSLGVSFLTSRLIKLVARSERFRRLARRSGRPLRAQQRTLEGQIRSSAGLGCITVQNTEPETMFRLGRLFLRAWVRLNLSGFGVQVMANPSIHVFQHVVGILPKDYPAESARIFSQGERVLTEAFDLQEGEIPAWMFRTGKSSPLPVEMRTLRRPLASVIRSESEASP